MYANELAEHLDDPPRTDAAGHIDGQAIRSRSDRIELGIPGRTCRNVARADSDGVGAWNRTAGQYLVQGRNRLRALYARRSSGAGRAFEELWRCGRPQPPRSISRRSSAGTTSLPSLPAAQVDETATELSAAATGEASAPPALINQASAKGKFKQVIRSAPSPVGGAVSPQPHQ